MSPGGNCSLFKIDTRSTNEKLIGTYSALKASITICRKAGEGRLCGTRSEDTTVRGDERALNLFTITSF